MHGMHGSNVAQAGVWTALQQQVKKVEEVEEVEDQVKEVRSKEGEICEVEKTWNCVTPKSFFVPKSCHKIY